MFSRPFWDLAFRPFFLLAALLALVAIPLWVAMYAGVLPNNGYLRLHDWHSHEMIFGFTMAIIAGFLLTAVRNWTKHATVSGAALAGLAALWTAGRFAIYFAESLPRLLPAAVDLAFLPLVALAVLIPIWRAKNWRNIAFVPLLLALAACNAGMHLKALGAQSPLVADSATVAIDLVIIILVIVGGRIIPLFTRNAIDGLAIRRSAWADRAVVPVLVLMALCDVSLETRKYAAALAIVASVVNLARMSGWGGRRSLGRPIVWILHLGYLWIVAGLALKGAATYSDAIHRSIGTHALTAGAITTLVIAMMARVALGHTGRKIVAGRVTTIAFLLITTAALLRTVVTALQVDWYLHSLYLAAACWTLAFGSYLASYLPVLFGPRADGRRDWRIVPPQPPG